MLQKFYCYVVQLYDKLRTAQPDFMDKVRLVNGDIMEDNLGISDKDRATLEENIHIVFHSAATIRFNEPLR